MRSRGCNGGDGGGGAREGRRGVEGEIRVRKMRTFRPVGLVAEGIGREVIHGK
jgi:hypothetical protein